MRQDGVCDAEVAFRVLEVDGVDLVRHSARTDFASLDLLTEVLHRDVLPEVAVKVDNDRVDALHGIENGAKAVVVAYLSRVFLAFEAETPVERSGDADAEAERVFKMLPRQLVAVRRREPVLEP